MEKGEGVPFKDLARTDLHTRVIVKADLLTATEQSNSFPAAATKGVKAQGGKKA